MIIVSLVTSVITLNRHNLLYVSTMVKNLPASAGDSRDRNLIPGSGRSPGGRNGKPLQYSCLKISMDRGSKFMELQRVRHNWVCEHVHMYSHYNKIVLKDEMRISYFGWPLYHFILLYFFIYLKKKLATLHSIRGLSLQSRDWLKATSLETWIPKH